jgi:signal transduction histidine kinase/AraC-like DNA-binding protein
MMLRTLRIGARIGSADPFWVQAREAVYHHAQQLGINLVPINIGRTTELSAEHTQAMVEELLAHDLHALICSYLPDYMIWPLLEAGLPIVHLTETDIRHPLLVSAFGFYEIGQQMGHFVAQQLGGVGRVLAIGGLLAPAGEDGRTRLKGFREVLDLYPQMECLHTPSVWRYEHAYPQIYAALEAQSEPFDAIFGLSDSLALAARDALRAMNRALPSIVGVNGDPLALAAIADGSMLATIDTMAADLGIRGVKLAVQAARLEPTPDHLHYTPRLVSAENVSHVAMEKLIAIADLPSRLVGVNRQQEQQRLSQLETSLEINRRMSSVLDRQSLIQEVAELIRSNYGYDQVHFWLWQPYNGLLYDSQQLDLSFTVDQMPLLAHTLERNEAVFVPDRQQSQRFAMDVLSQHVRSQVVVPVRFGETILGLLDLQSVSVLQHNRQSLAALQVLADQLGVLMRNAELYEEALEARDAAEKADQLKTRLLANVSHELRTPLNVILGYSQSALSEPNPYQIELPEALRNDLQHIYRSGEHLIRLINDLLDLSRAEIDELELYPETIALQPFLHEIWQSVSEGLGKQHQLEFLLNLPEQLPLIEADSLRLRQILLNLLSNAIKFTDSGQIILGAEVSLPHVHIWVSDTGSGIPVDLQEQIFEPFVTGSRATRQAEGAGLGLAISRRLVALHQGTITLESQVDIGSTFHIYLPLPTLSGLNYVVPQSSYSAVLLVGNTGVSSDFEHLQVNGQMLPIYRVATLQAIPTVLAQIEPAAVVWDSLHALPSDWQLLEQLRQDPRICQAPFILYGDSLVAHGSGSIGIVHKPLNNQRLRDVISSLLQPSQQAILVIDDDADTRTLYRHMIAHSFPQQRVIEAKDGAEALEMIQYELPSLILLDLMMPEMNGFAVLEVLRSNERTWHIPVVVISGQMLSLADVQRLDHAQVVFQSKDILSDHELADLLQSQLEPGQGLARQTSVLVKRALAYIHKHYDETLSRQAIADAVGVSKNYLSQIFHQELGISPWEYLNRYRIKQAKQLLRNSAQSISWVACQVGFEDASYFGRVFRKQVGCSPQTYRDQV